MPLGREVGLGPSDIVLDGNPAPLPQKWDRSPQFSTHDYCDPAPPTKKGTVPSFRPMFIVAKRSPISGAGEKLYLLK